MKVVILAGGFGTRISEESAFKPRGNATANYVQYLAKALQEEGFCVTVMSALNSEFELSDGDVIGGITVRNIRWESKFSYIRRLLNGRLFPFVLAGKIVKLKLTSDDILIVPTSLPAISTLFRLKKKYKFKTIGYPLEWFGVEQYKTPGEAKKGEFQFQLNAKHDLLFPISYHIRNQFPKTPALVLPIMADVTEFPFVPKEMDVCRFILPANGMMKDALPEMLHGLALLTKEELSRLEFHFTGVTENQIKSILNDFEYEKIKNSVTLHLVIKDIINRANFPIKYIFLERNSGKHVAQNRAVDAARGEFFVPLDSDDYVIPETLEVFWKAWNSIPDGERSEYCGVGVHCMDLDGNMIGDPYPADRMVSNDLEMCFKYRVRGEKWGMIRTDIMREFKNIEVKGHFLSESTVWFRIAQKYPKKLFLQKCLRFYEVHDDSVTKQLENSQDYNIESTIVSECIYMNEFYDWYLRYQFKQAIRKPISLTLKCIVNDKEVLFGKDALIKKVNPLLCKFLIFVSSIYKVVWKVKSKI